MAGSAIFVGLFIPLNLILDLGEYPAFIIIYAISSVVFIAEVFVEILRFKHYLKSYKPFEPKATAEKYLPWVTVDLVPALLFMILFPGSPLQLLKLFI